MRLVLTLLLVVVAGLCGFGLLATLEPMDSDQQLFWRVCYGAGALLCLVGAGALWAGGRAGDRDG